MKIFNKFKQYFIDEEDIVDEIKTESIKVEIPGTDKIKAEIKPKPKETPAIYFPDDILIDRKKKEEVKVEKPKVKVVKKEMPIQAKDSYNQRIEKKKRFKPSPIISPIYGLIDSRDEINSGRSNVRSAYSRSEDVSIDEVMKKVHGTAEEIIENRIKEEKEEFDMLDFNLNGVLDREEIIPSIEEDNVVEDLLEEVKKEEEEEDILSKDLYNLIDEMYEKGASNGS